MSRASDPVNATRWPIGSLVIHVHDAKMKMFLMRVTGYTDGLARTRYVRPSSGWLSKKVFLNDVRNLLDPALFGIDVT